MAIHFLADLALTDVTPPSGVAGGGGPSDTCSKVYSSIIGANDIDAAGAQRAFGVGLDATPLYFHDALAVNSLNASQLANERLTFEAHVLRAGARMLERLVRKSVFADLAAADSRAAQATDHLAGQQVAWGLEPSAAPAYNSMAHAVRLLSGRWEMSPYLEAPRDSGIPPMRLLERAYGPQLSARVEDKSISTAQQADVVKLLEATGIVLPKTVIETVSTATVRQAIRKQMIANIAAANGVTVEHPSMAIHQQAIDAKLESISDADLKFGLERMLSRFRNYAVAGDEVTDLATGFSHVHTSPNAVDEIKTGLAGTVVKGGLGCDKSGGELRARYGGVEASSQGADLGGLAALIDPDKAFATAYQDTFSLANMLYRRLVVLRSASETAGASMNTKSVVQQAAAETRSWAGNRIIISGTPDGDQGAIGSLSLKLVGYEPKDFGASSDDAAMNQIVLVHGPPWAAECAARLRDACPDNFEANYVAYPVPASKAASSALSLGSDGRLLEMTFLGSTQGGPINFSPRYGSHRAAGTAEAIYVVARSDAASPAMQGKVLGALALRDATTSDGQLSAVGTVDSSLKWWLSNSVVGARPMGRSVDMGESCGADRPSTCLDGVPKDMFVPLENELTSDSDQFENSWKHYLVLAKQAADRADQLGQKLIELGLQQDLRREAAQEELAGICGDFVAASEVSFSNGELVPPADDPSFQLCLDEKSYDFVFLTTNPLEGKPGNPYAFLPPVYPQTEAGLASWKTDLLRLLLSCDTPTGATNPLCAPGALVNVRVAGLNLKEWEPFTFGLSSDCSALISASKTLYANFDSQPIKNVAGSFAEADLAEFVRDLRVTKYWDGGWTVHYLGKLIMSSAPDQPLWPGCLISGSTACDDSAADYSKLFRSNWVVESAGPCAPDSKLVAGAYCIPLLGVGLPSGVTAAVEKELLLWRVEGAVWMLGAMANSIPEQLFDVEAPVADFSQWSTSPGSAPLLTVYGDANFINSADGYQLASAINPSWNNSLTGLGATFYGAGQGFLLPPLVTGDLSPTQQWSEIPTWLARVVNSSEPYRSARAQNGAVTGFKLVVPQEGGVEGVAELKSTDPNKVKTWLETVASGFHGMGCAQGGFRRFSGSPNVGDSSLVAQSTDLVKRARFPSSGSKYENGVVHDNDVICSLPLGTGLFVERFSTDYPGADFRILDWSGACSDCQFGSGTGGECADPVVQGVQHVQSDCLANKLYCPDGYGGKLLGCDPLAPDSPWAGQRTGELLSPTDCGPSKRARLLVNSYPPPGACGAAAQITQALALTCHVSQTGAIKSLDEPPVISSTEEITRFERWVSASAVRAAKQLSVLHLEKVPDRVVEDFHLNKVGTGALKGAHGALLLSLEQQLQTLFNGWVQVTTGLGELHNAVKVANADIQFAQLTAESEAAQFAIAEIQTHMAQTQAINQAVSACGGLLGSVASLNPASVAGGMTSMIASLDSAMEQVRAGEQLMKEHEKILKIKDQQAQSSITMALYKLNQTSGPIYEKLQLALSSIRSGTAAALSVSHQLAESQNKAKYEAAKATGAPFAVLDDDGTQKAVDLPVNHVLNAEYDITRRRYDAALADARYLAYVARIAIEQRIGARLKTIRKRVGALDAPSRWADDLCTFQGVDYDSLRGQPLAAGGAGGTAQNAGAANTGTSPFLGDYVQKLEDFVEYYNIDFPSHEGDDTVVISLRDDVLGERTLCRKEAPNRLYYSGELYQAPSSPGSEGASQGWSTTLCKGGGKCLEVLPPSALKNPPRPPVPNGVKSVEKAGSSSGGAGSGVSWLRDVTATFPTGSLKGAGISQPAVVQQVHLGPGSYTLSWWDQARASDGGVPQTAPPAYMVSVQDGHGVTFASRAFQPFSPATSQDAKEAWSDRRSLPFAIEDEGDVLVAFSASDGFQTNGSVLIAEVQLEQTPSDSGGPSAYIQTGASREYFTGAECALPIKDLRAAFRHTCLPQGECYYELIDPITVALGGPLNPKNSFVNRLARGNYNYRHISSAVNLVGTGLLDCTGASTSCYASSFAEYNLTHEAFSAGVTGWSGTAQTFNFGRASIRHGRALSAEKFITFPISSSDQGLLSQPGITKGELRGRPLDGSYSLVIWDTPALRWDRLEDVQIVLNYRYWSVIDPGPGTK